MIATSSTRIWFSTLVAGFVTGFLAVVSAASFAALIVAGSLDAYLPQAIGITLVSAVLTGSIVAIFSSYAGTVAIPQDRVAPILALLAALIVDRLGGDVSGELKFLTVMAAIVVSTFLTGMILLGFGLFRLGRFIRFIPYPVIGGFLAGTGWLLTQGSFRVMLQGSPAGHIGSGWSLVNLMVWLPGTVMAVLLVIVSRHYRHFLIVPCALVATVAIFYAVSYSAGYDLSAATEAGWTLGPFPEDIRWSYLAWEALSTARWDAVIVHPASFATIALVSALSLLLNSTALEIAARQDMDLDRELRVTGSANLIAACGGGMVGIVSLSISSLALRMGARGRLIGLTAAGLAFLVLVVGIDALTYLPRTVVGGLLLFLGLSFLVEWLYDGYQRLSLGDYLVVLLILATVATFGFIEGVAVGLLGAVCLFAVNYSRVLVVRQSTNLVERQSNVDRPPRHRRVLKNVGEHAKILRLQGFLFFGTANRLFVEMRSMCETQSSGSQAVEFVILDFARVTGMDSSAVLSFAKISQLATRFDFKLIFSDLDKDLEHKLRTNEFDILASERVMVFPDLDHAVEWCEDQLLNNQTLILPSGGLGTLKGQLEDLAGGVVDVERLIKYLERREVPSGSEFIHQGDEANDMYFIESGLVTINLVLDNAEQLRIRKMGPGTVTGELGLYLGGSRNASVIADTDAVVFRLSKTALSIMEDQEPELAAAFHHYMARMLAERLVQTNRAIRGLLD